MSGGASRPCPDCGATQRAPGQTYCRACAAARNRTYYKRTKRLAADMLQDYAVYVYGDPGANEAPLVRVGTAQVTHA